MTEVRGLWRGHCLTGPPGWHAVRALAAAPQ